MRWIALLFLSCICIPMGWAQSYTPEVMPGADKQNYEWGASLKVAVSISNASPVIRIGSSVGIGILALNNDVFPSAHLEWDVYLNGLGTRSGSPHHKNQLTTDVFLAATLTGRLGGGKYTDNYYKNPAWNQPLYCWSDFAQPPLQNPFWNSLSVGSVWALSFDKQKRLAHGGIQRIGFLNGHADQFDLSYTNDGGGLISQSRLGDHRDRMYTGCGHLSFHPKTMDGINSYELSFHRYTGYSRQAFELSCDMHLGFVDYHDSVQQYYSRSEFCLRVGSTTQGWAGTVRWINPRNRREVQNLIHYIGDFSQHQILYPTGFALGADFSPFATKIYSK